MNRQDEELARRQIMARMEYLERVQAYDNGFKTSLEDIGFTVKRDWFGEADWWHLDHKVIAGFHLSLIIKDFTIIYIGQGLKTVHDLNISYAEMIEHAKDYIKDRVSSLLEATAAVKFEMTKPETT